MFIFVIGSGRESFFVCFPDTHIRKSFPGQILDPGV